MRDIARRCGLSMIVLVLVPCAWAGEGTKIKKSPLDHVVIYESVISKDSPIRIRDFPTENADLGTGADPDKPKYQAIAQEMKEKVPALTLEAAIKGLREAGFKDVETIKDGVAIPEDALVVEGEFTKLNPGSKSKRYAVGFGAGKSQVCASGRVVRGTQGIVLMEFDHCRNQAIGFFGGNSGNQMENDAEGTGSHFAEFMAKWAEGKYTRD